MSFFWLLASPGMRPARRATSGGTAARSVENGKRRARTGKRIEVSRRWRILLDAFRGFLKRGVLPSTRATGTVTMCRNWQTERVGAEVRDLAEKIDRGFRVAAFQFAIGGAHAAQRSNPAIGANRLAGVFGMADFFHPAIPTLPEGAGAEVISIAVREHTDSHAPAGINGAPVLAATAGVSLRGSREIRSAFAFGELRVSG